MKNKSNIFTRKIKLFPVGDKEEIDRVYKYLRDGMKSQTIAMSDYYNTLYVLTKMEITEEDRKELNTLFQRISTSKLGSGYDKNTIKFPVGLQMANLIQKKVNDEFFADVKKGLMYGKVGCRNYGIDNPLLIHVNYIRPKIMSGKNTGLYHTYATNEEFEKHLYDTDLEVFLDIANHITFKCVFGNPHNSAALRDEIYKVFCGEYEVGGSSIGIEETKIILNLTLKIPVKEHFLDENIIIGVDLGQAIPATCAVNNNKYDRLYIGSADDFKRKRTQIQSQYRRTQKSLNNTNGGHGRKKKLKALDKFEEYEKNFAKTYNHMVSKRVVDFALKHNAQYINLEYLKGFDTSKKVLRNWSYYQLQTYIEQKAAKYGIIVRYINPCYTSQVCSECGHWGENQRKTQSEFICASGCFSNTKHKKINADFNAARNISNSTLFIDRADDYKKEDLIKQARAYYGIE